MEYFARIQDSVVAEIFSPPDGFSITDCFAPGFTWVKCEPAVQSGWTYSGNPPFFCAPTAIQPSRAPQTQLSSLEFMKRLTPTEQMGLAAAAQINASVLLIMMRWSAASFIDVSDPVLTQAIDELIALELIAPSRRTALLATIV